MNTTTIDMWGKQATVGSAARSTEWLATAPAFALHHASAIAPMSSAYVVKNAKGIRHRPPEDSNTA